MSQITMGSTYESNYYEWVIWVKLIWVVHMSQITMSSTMSQITMSSTYESNYYE